MAYNNDSRPEDRRSSNGHSHSRPSWGKDSGNRSERGGGRKNNGERRSFNDRGDKRFERDGERNNFGERRFNDRGGKRFERDGERRDFGDRGGKRFERDGERNNFGERRFNDRGGKRFERDGERRNFGDRGGKRFERDGERRDFGDRGGKRFERDGERRNFGDRGGKRFERDGERNNFGERRFNDRGGKRFGRDGDRRFDGPRKGSAGFREARDAERRERREMLESPERFEADRLERMKEGREPYVPSEITGQELEPALRGELKALTKEQMERVSRHLVACAMFSGEDAERALEHAKWAARFGARVPAVREIYGSLLYEAGDYKGALRELRAAMRMSGAVDFLPMIADCDRGLGRPEKALEVAQSPEARKLTNQETIELMIVVAGAYADMGDLDTALATLEVPALRHKVDGAWQFRLWLAYADILEALGRPDEARKWVTLAADADTEEETDAYLRLGRSPRIRPAMVEETDEQVGLFDVEAAFEREEAERLAAEEDSREDVAGASEDSDADEGEAESAESEQDEQSVLPDPELSVSHGSARDEEAGVIELEESFENDEDQDIDEDFNDFDSLMEDEAAATDDEEWTESDEVLDEGRDS